MTEKDFFVAPFYFLFLMAYSINLRNKRYPKGHPYRKYYLPALLLKFIGAIAAGLVYYFYYSDGDTRGFFRIGTYIYNILLENPNDGLALLFPSKNYVNENVYYTLHSLRAFADSSSYMVYRIVAIVNFIALNTYSSVALIFAYFSFKTSWRVFELFSNETPAMTKKFAISILFIPSVIFWGSGIFKDTICFGCVMILMYSIYKIFLERKLAPRLALEMIIAIYLLVVIKTYIVLSFLPAIGIWIFLTYQKKIKNAFTKMVSTPLFVGLSVVFAGFTMSKIGEINPEFAIQNIQEKMHDMQWWHEEVHRLGQEDGGRSFYTLGSAGDFSTWGMIKKFPLAVNVTLFRPYLWEARSIFVLMAAFESLYFFLLTLHTLYKVGLGRTFAIVITNPIVLFSLSFAIFFAFGVGFTSYNFGALVRYKIPCMPFYLLALYFIRYHYELSKSDSNKPIHERRERINYQTAL